MVPWIINFVFLSLPNNLEDKDAYLSIFSLHVNHKVLLKSPENCA